MTNEVTIETTLGYVRALNSWGAIDKGHDLPALKNVALFIDKDNLKAAATNRYSIVSHETIVGGDLVSSVDAPDNQPILIPFLLLSQFVKAAVANKNAGMPVSIRIDEDYIEIQMYEILVRGAKTRGQYPRVDTLMDDKDVVVSGVKTFGFPSKQFAYVPKLIAPGSNAKPVDYSYQVTFSGASDVNKVGPMVLTLADDTGFMVVIQPLFNLKNFAWKGATNE